MVGVFIWNVRTLKKFEGLSRNFLAFSKVPSWGRRWMAYVSYLLAIVLCILALGEPYVYIDRKYQQYEDIRLIFVVDVSRSMVYAEDVPPNRLEATKQQIKEFYNSLDGVYEASILPFAGDVNPYFCPFTTNPNSFLNTLKELDWRSAPALGTDLSKAVEAIEEVYVNKDKIDKNGINIIILLSDGGREEALATNRPRVLQLARKLAAKNFRFYTVGVGSDKPAPLMLRDGKGNFIRYLTDKNNQIETSLMDKEILKQISDEGKGKYYALNSSSALAYDLQKVMKENRKAIPAKTRIEKLYLQPYLFSVTVILLFWCLLLNKV
jgi:Ca-activated chloride channel family protein